MVLLLALAVALSWTMISSNEKNAEERRQLVGQKRLLESELGEKEASIDELLTLMSTVEEQVEEIIQRENLVYNQRLDGVTPSEDEQLLQEIAMIEELVDRSKASVKSMEEKLRLSNLRSNVFQKKIKSLTADLNKRQELVADLKNQLLEKNAEIGTLVVKVDSLKDDVFNKEMVIEAKTAEVRQLTAENDLLHKGYFAIGSFQELKTRGLVAKTGGFLWFGRTIDVLEDDIQNEFLEIDTRTIKELPIEASKVNLLSDHPSDSYQLKDGSNENIKVLEITNPTAFWKASKYLVISKKS